MTLQFGKLREKVKAGDVDPADALRFVQVSRDPSPDLIAWLKNFDLETHRARSPKEYDNGS